MIFNTLADGTFLFSDWAIKPNVVHASNNFLLKEAEYTWMLLTNSTEWSDGAKYHVVENGGVVRHVYLENIEGENEWEQRD